MTRLFCLLFGPLEWNLPADSLMDEMSNTDSYSFMNENVPSVLLSSGGFDEHHTVLDKIDLIDFEHLRKATVLLDSMVEKLGNHFAPYGR